MIHCDVGGDDYCNFIKRLDMSNLWYHYFLEKKPDWEGLFSDFNDKDFTEVSWLAMCLTWFEMNDEEECKSWLTTDNGQPGFYNPTLHPEKFSKKYRY